MAFGLDAINAAPGMIHSFWNPQEGYEDAAKEYEKYYNESKGFQEPFRQNGLDQTGRLNNAENSLLDPSKLLGEWMDKYKTSPYAQRSMQNASASGLDAASSQGLLGSSAATQNIQQSSSDIMNKDRSEYLQDLMQKYMAGIGIGQNMYGIGASTAQNMGNNAMNMGGAMGAAKYGAASAPGNMARDLISAGAKAYGGGAGGGA